MKQILVIKRDSEYFAYKVQVFELEIGPTEMVDLENLKASSKEATNTMAFR